MLTSANVEAAQAANYYEKDDYYTQGDPDLQSDTRWQGKGAEELGLNGPVDATEFQQLLHGETPDGKSLHARKIDPENHRAATDYTFSAPKSVSIAALIQKDKRVIAAHDQAVETALTVLEARYAKTRVRSGQGMRERVQTGNIIAATFRHETSREQDPQLHTHCVVMNATQLEDGRWQSMANEDVMNNKKLLGEIYQNELAVELRKLGYEIEPQGNGLFECKGYDKPLLELFSTRSKQIEKYVEQWEESLKEKGGTPLSASQKKQATLATRLRKESVPREVLLKGWEKSIASDDIYLPALPEAGPIEFENQAQVAATAGVSHASERESVFKLEKVERFVLEQYLGKQSFSEVQSALKETDLVWAKEAKQLYTTEAAIERELDTVALMKGGQGQVDAIATFADVKSVTADEMTLTAGQYAAIVETAISRDQFVAWQGVAGAGKTYSLRLLAQLATEQGYAVTGYAPSAQAANVLSEEAGIEGNTVARLLHSKDKSDGQKQAIWIVDEAGLLSAKDAHSLLEKARGSNARVVLIGDTRQLSAVEAGNPFRSLQSAGIKTSYLEESRRQKTAALRTAVVSLSAGQQAEGLSHLEGAGMVREVEDATRHLEMTRDYIKLSPAARESTLILSGTNVERLALTADIRRALQAEGSLGDDVFKLESLRSQDRTGAQLKYACAYAVDDVIVPVKDYPRHGLKRREQYRVAAQDIETNRLTLEGPDGAVFSFDPATCSEKTAYSIQQLDVAPGDQLRWTRNEAVDGVRNGQVVTVEAINADGAATVRDTKGEVMTLDLTGQQYLDYALVSTTYSSQGKTADQVLADIDSTLSKEGLYVAVSRAKSDLRLYTKDKKKLYKKAERSAAKANPSDHLTLFELVNPDAKREEATRHSRAVRGADQSEYIGDSVGARVEASYRTAVRRDRSAAPGSQSAERTAGKSGQQSRTAADRPRQQRLVAEREPFRQQYRKYAAGYEGASAAECDRLVVRQMATDLLSARGGSSLTTDELKQLARVLAQGSTTQGLKRAQGREVGLKYVVEVLSEERAVVEEEQSTELAKSSQEQAAAPQNKAVQKQNDNGLEL